MAEHDETDDKLEKARRAQRPPRESAIAANASLDLRNLAAATDEETPYLGDVAVLEALVGALLFDISEVMLASQTDPAADLRPAFDARINPLVDILLGHNPDYAPVPQWNVDRDSGISRFVASVYGAPDTADPKTRLRLALYTLVADVTRAARALDAGEDWRMIIEGAENDMVRTLAGDDPRSD